MKNPSPWLFCLFACTFIQGCGGGGSRAFDVQRDPTIFFVNAASDSSGLDWLLNGNLKAANQRYLSSSSGFESLRFLSQEDRSYDIISRATGTSIDLDRDARVLEKDRDYLVVGFGLIQFGTEFFKRYRHGIFSQIDRTRPIGNVARIYVLHAFLKPTGQDTPNITFQNPGRNPQFVVRDIRFGELKQDDSRIGIDAGTFDFIVKRADTDESIYITQRLTLQAGKIYLVLVSGIEGQAPATGRDPKITLIELPPKA